MEFPGLTATGSSPARTRSAARCTRIRCSARAARPAGPEQPRPPPRGRRPRRRATCNSDRTPRGPLRRIREPLDLLARDLLPYLVLGQLPFAALAPVGVLGLDHLIDVLHLELDLVLVGAGRPPVEKIGAG